MPASFAFLAFGQQIVSFLYGHGTVTPAQSHNLGYMLMAFSLGLIPYSAFFVMLRGFYAYEDTKTPFILALWIGVANGGLAYLSYVLLGNTRWAVAGICAAYSISYLIGLIITAVRLHKLVGRFDGKRARRRNDRSPRGPRRRRRDLRRGVLRGRAQAACARAGHRARRGQGAPGPLTGRRSRAKAHTQKGRASRRFQERGFICLRSGVGTLAVVCLPLPAGPPLVAALCHGASLVSAPCGASGCSRWSSV